MTDGLHIPDQHIAWQRVVEASPDMSVPFGVHVFIFHTIEQLQAACGDPHANGFSSTWDAADASNVGALMMLTMSDLHLSIVAHEVAHIALFHHRTLLKDRVGARRWLHEHPETVAEMIGNLTSLIWYAIPTADEIHRWAPQPA